MRNYSILRNEEYKHLKEITLTGTVLDVGGGKSAGYHSLIEGRAHFVSININEKANPDIVADIEKGIPLEGDMYDGVVCMNVMEHIYSADFVFSEMIRCLKSGGMLVCSTPFMHYIHASPDDYYRYTGSVYQKLAEKNNCTIVAITPLGKGFFSVCHQFIAGIIPLSVLRQASMYIASILDGLLYKYSSRYRDFAKTIPLGYFVVMRKN